MFLRRFLLAIALLIVVTILASEPYRCSRIWIDETTASIRGETSWFFFLRTSSSIKRSAIENWIIARRGSYTPVWRFLSSKGDRLFGRSSRGCAMAPEIYVLHGDLNDRFVHSSTDEELTEFVRIMQTATEAEKANAVALAGERAMRVGWERISPVQ